MEKNLRHCKHLLQENTIHIDKLYLLKNQNHNGKSSNIVKQGLAKYVPEQGCPMNAYGQVCIEFENCYFGFPK